VLLFVVVFFDPSFMSVIHGSWGGNSRLCLFFFFAEENKKNEENVWKNKMNNEEKEKTRC